MPSENTKSINIKISEDKTLGKPSFSIPVNIIYPKHKLRSMFIKPRILFLSTSELYQGD